MMERSIISTCNLTKDYGQGRGIFGIDLDIHEGEVFGFLGTNGAGKTTVIRHMMGFIRSDWGTVNVAGMDPWRHAPQIMQHVSYIPGEIAFPSVSKGTDFLKLQAQFLEVTDFTRMDHLIDAMGLDPSADLKRMSKGMKQKTAIVAALMGEREILILDEPTTGLDPLMRETFLKILQEEKKKGRTIFMSTHIFSEIEAVCDRAAILANGQIQAILTLKDFQQEVPRNMTIRFSSEGEAQTFAERWEEASVAGSTVTCQVPAQKMNDLMQALRGLPVQSLQEEHMDLGQYFMKVYGREKVDI